ncbi:hypothetical protein [Rubinisphaera sp.]|uniref:hypothetical protein n=1 Tax=Rubinisphaera sp. TaxID=2024857 RepID=UPI000C1101BD|nr:hypothetical protein [Rubinisphaera sp.]MBV10286.1 hypothetical protein [Rubinisphaera sp.]HCS50676.1 hypothetical protein [Planctomycetaceae bacterium]|tara:strand:- start:221 stop:910 length:690 start_codon:yes stop_codon:yes gene_type:complete
MAENMQEYLKKTNELTRKGEYVKALERTLWFHDHALEHDQAMSGVRLSFALGYWEDLGKVYPQAKTAMIETRDRKLKLLQENKGNIDIFKDVVALNRTLGEDSKSIIYFDEIDKQNSEQAERYWIFIKRTIIAAKRYDLIKKYLDSFDQEFQSCKYLYEIRKKNYNKIARAGDQFKSHNENHFVEECLTLIEVAQAIDDPTAAKSIQQKALAVLDDPRLRKAIPTNGSE